MRSRVAGVAGSARVRRLDAVGLAKAEAHGKRDDWSSRKRRVRDVPPVTLNSAAMGAAGITHDLDLRQRYAEHVAGAKLHGAIFDGAKLRNASLVGAIAGTLPIANSDGSQSNRAQPTSFVNADLTGAQVKGFNIGHAVTEGARLP